MIEQITKRQKELLTIIYRYIKNRGYPPTFEEMREELGVSSNQSIIDLLRKLEQKRIIKKGEAVARGIVILQKGYQILKKIPVVPFLGTVTAGTLLDTIEVSGKWQEVPGDITKLKSNVFILRIDGDSMINAGINNGDFVLVEERKEFVSGDIVLAQDGNESTIKRFIKDNKPPFVYLKPENPKYDIIPFNENIRLKGKVISIFKNKKLELVK